MRAADIPLKPQGLVFEVTDACNSRCIHCNIWKKKPTPNMLTCKEVEKIFSDELLSGLKSVLLTGGEVTLRSDLNELISTIHNCIQKASIVVSTNGLLPQRALDSAKFAIEHNIPIDIGVSLDGIGEHHNKIRGVPGNFQKVDWLLHELIKLRKKHKALLGVGVGYTLSDLTVDYYDKVKEYANKLCLDFVPQMYEVAPYYTHTKADICKVTKQDKLFKIVKDLPQSMHKEVLLRAVTSQPIKFRCFSMNSFCVLRCNGNITPCLRKSDVVVGNVREATITQIWHSSEAKKVRNIVKKCEGCLNTWCTGWSSESSYFPFLSFYLRHPRLLMDKIAGS
jgi:radical SAM protein with 4Fe4S-binding SPASM domain